MTKALGRGLRGSLRARARAEVAQLVRDNRTIRQSQYGAAERLLRFVVVGRPLEHFVLFYLLCVASALAIEWFNHSYLHWFLQPWNNELHGFIKDFAGFFITAQVGILAIVTVAVAVVTLLSQAADGATAKTSIALYYHESYAYQVAVSGIALLIVVATQLFWPVHHFLQQFGWGGTDLSGKIALTGVHAAWLIFNFILFLRFIITTLRFVEPARLAHMRLTYTASVAIPADLERSLLPLLLGNAGQQLFGADELKRGPDVTFGYSYNSEDASTEIERRFHRPRILWDVWTAPLSLAIKSWLARTRTTPPRQPTTSDKRTWDGELILPYSFDRAPHDTAIVLERHRGAALLWWERLAISGSFRFRSSRLPVSALATPSDFLNELISNLIWQIEKGALDGFKSALREVVSYHSFLLAALNTEDENGAPYNFAQLGGSWVSNDYAWLFEYRRAYQAAAEKLSLNVEFMEWLGGVPSSLFPEQPQSFPQAILRGLFDLGLFQVSTLEAWITSHTLPTYNPLAGSTVRLAGNDAAAYERVLISVVGSWESFAQRLAFCFRLRKLKSKSPRDRWRALAAAWPSFEAHLRSCCYFLVAAVWNDDESGADRYRDMLLRWLNVFYDYIHNDFNYRNHFLFTPELFDREWSDVEAFAVSNSRFGNTKVAPGEVFGLVVKGVFEDAVTIAAAITLSWYARDQQATDIGARAATKSMRREKLDEGSDLAASVTEVRSAFRLAFDLLLRHALSPRFGEPSYAAALDGFVRHLSGTSSKRMVSGRIYSGWGLEGVDTLRPALLAIMAANVPSPGEEGVQRIIADLLADGAPLSDSDTARSFVFTLGTLIRTLGEEVHPAFERAIHAFNPDLDAEECRANLHSLLNAVLTAVEASQRARLANAPLDKEKVTRTKRMITEGLLSGGPDIHCFKGFRLEQDGRSDVLQTDRFGYIDRGAFSTPHMSAISFEEYARIIVEEAERYLARAIWHDFFKRERKAVEIDLTQGLKHFWRTVIATATSVGSNPAILVPYDRIGEGIALAGHGLPSVLDDFQIVRDPGITGGGGTGYLGTIEGVNVFAAEVAAGIAPMFSMSSLRAITYGVVSGDDEVVDFSFVEGENPVESWVLLSFAQSTTWDDTPVMEFHYRPEDLPTS